MSRISPEYTQRIDRVIDHLRENLDRPFRLQELAEVACFSAYHFHRIFGAVTGETLNDFTSRLRLEKAVRLLKFSKRSATEIALECGFSSSATFSRSFKAAYGVSPSAFRKAGDLKDSKIRKELFPESAYILPMTDAEKEKAFPVEIRRFPAWNVAYIRVANSYEGNRVLEAFGELTAWAKSEKVFSDGVLFGMSIDDPEVTPRHLHRYEVCLASSGRFSCPPGISRAKMPARSYAVTRIDGDIRVVATAWDYLFRNWLVRSRYEPEHAPALEIFLEKEKATDWSNFKLDLCLPVKLLD